MSLASTVRCLRIAHAHRPSNGNFNRLLPQIHHPTSMHDWCKKADKHKARTILRQRQPAATPPRYSAAPRSGGSTPLQACPSLCADSNLSRVQQSMPEQPTPQSISAPRPTATRCYSHLPPTFADSRSTSKRPLAFAQKGYGAHHNTNDTKGHHRKTPAMAIRAPRCAQTRL